MITVREINFSYDIRPILKDISFSAKDGHLLCILGANGAGKSTLFQCILGLQKGYRGEILLDHEDIGALSVKKRAEKMAYIPQSHHPVFHYSVRDMVLMGTVSSSSGFGKPGKAEQERAAGAIDRLGIGHLAEANYGKISGGEQQLVLLARALAQGAKTLIMDEPTANLDYGNQIKVQQQMRKLADEGYTVIQSTHNPEHAYLFADDVLALVTGEVYAFGSPQEVIQRELIETLYGISVAATSLYHDRVRVFVPSDCMEQEADR